MRFTTDRTVRLGGIALVLATAAIQFSREADVMDGTTASAQAAPVPEAVSKGFGQVASWVEEAARLVPEERYAYRPVEGVRTFGQLVAHLIDSYQYYCRLAAGSAEWSDATERLVTGKAELLRRLTDAGAACRAAHARGGLAPLVENLGHTNLHYGNMVTYLRVMGLVPPSSR